MKSVSFTRLGGKTKGGRPIVNKYFVGSSQGSAQSSFLKNFLLFLLIIGFGLWFYWLHTNGLIVWFNRNLISEYTFFAIDLNIVQLQAEHYIFSLANALLMGVYLSALLPFSGKRWWWINVSLVIMITVFAILSFGYVGLYLYINVPFLAEKTYISNAIEGMQFFMGNLPWFLILYAISILIESETE